MQETPTGQLIFLLRKCSAEILRHRCQETHRLPGDGMSKFQLEGMQGLASDPVKNRMIKEISGERTADVFHMDTDLMCTSRVQMKFHKRIAVTDSKAFIMSYRSFSMLPVYFSGDNGVIHSCNGRGNGSSFRWNSICKSQVSAADLALFHLSRQKCTT